MSNLTAVRQKIGTECFCSRCGYRMIEGDEAYLSAATLEVGALTHVLQLAWCLGCFSNFTANAYPKTPRVELNAAPRSCGNAGCEECYGRSHGECESLQRQLVKWAKAQR